MRTRGSLLLALGLSIPMTAASTTPAPRAENQPALDIRVHARAFVPGEPVRVVVVPEAPLAKASATFGEDDVHLVKRTVTSTVGLVPVEEWEGWAVIDLDQEPRDVRLEVKAMTSGGQPAHAIRSVKVEAKSFPEQSLKVAQKYVKPDPKDQERIARDNARLAKVYASRTAAGVLTSPFVRPVPGEPTGVFGSRRVFNGERRAPHSGLDLRAGTGTPVASSGPGRVALVHDLHFSGITVIVDHGGGLFTIYAHLSEAKFAEGSEVAAGDLLGLSGATGRVTGPHLHWGGKVGKRIFDPTALLDPALFGQEAGASAPAKDATGG